jgi:PucR C-terminal helix-turn-helix domain
LTSAEWKSESVPARSTNGACRDPQRGLDLLAMHQLCRRADGGAAILRWLTRRTGCWAGLVNRSGSVLVDATPDPTVMSFVTRGIEGMVDRGLSTFLTQDASRGALFLAVDVPTGVPGPVLVLVGDEHVSRSLAADAATVLGTCWWAEETRRIRERVDDAEARAREAVLHLLTSRHVSTARQIASALSPPLPDPVRVHVVECAADERGEVIRRCAELVGDSAWIVRCPVHIGHVIIVAAATACVEGALTTGVDRCVIGTGDVVALRDTAVGYEQAFHALAVARSRPERWARFDTRLDLATLVGPDGLAWATAVLTPLLTYVPARANDPDSQELMATARSWLSFSMAASRHLKIHRNTLVARLRLIGDLLGLDLGKADQQAVLDLALRIRAAPHVVSDPNCAVALDDLLRAPAVQQWARATLRPLREAANGAALESTLRAWLSTDSRLSATADALGISVPGARKRLCRLEQILQRSLLQSPTARHDLWWAIHAADLDG